MERHHAVVSQHTQVVKHAAVDAAEATAAYLSGLAARVRGMDVIAEAEAERQRAIRRAKVNEARALELKKRRVIVKWCVGMGGPCRGIAALAKI